ncbi:Hypothetical predicted protein [Olea europaea subsp. europaea]|uniref:Uncharacterized protein n=1 Tax=Olea europaea subsp. europaea TaxID=158383 RepID=A0A8S0PRP3_OLEEU|nr:Hypothetical predicted protein [Olea europaea subsp. europaea]
MTRKDGKNDLRAFRTGGPSPTVDGFPNNSFRAFKTRDDAEKAVAEFASSSNQVVQNENEDSLNVQLEI